MDVGELGCEDGQESSDDCSDSIVCDFGHGLPNGVNCVNDEWVS